jgi:arylsulfatase A-like enzyme
MLVRGLSLFIGLSLAVTSCSVEQARVKPNIVIVNIDNHEKSAMSYYGNMVTEMPNLDKLAGQSVRFENYYTASRCSPSRAALMTGRYAMRSGCYGTFGANHLMAAGVPTMGDYFRNGGYKTGLFGKWHLGSNYQYRPNDRGFDEVVSYMASNPERHGIEPGGKRALRWMFLHNKEWKQYDGFRTDIWFREMHRFIRESSRQDQPFLAYLATSSTHALQAGPIELVEKYKAKLEALDLSMLTDEEKTAINYSGVTILEQACEVSAELENIDRNIGKTLALLEELGQLDNTIFMYMSDGTGSFLPPAALMESDGNFEREIPMILSWPGGGLKTGPVNEVVANIDILPTLLDICGIPASEDLHFDGQSMFGLMREGKTPWQSRVYIKEMQSHGRKGHLHCYKPFDCTTLYMPEGIVYWGPSMDWGNWDRKIWDQKTQETPPELVEKARAYYEKWFDEVTGGGEVMTNYIKVGTELENPSWLFAVHYLIENGPAGKEAKQYIPVDFTMAGIYTISDVSEFPPGSGRELKTGTRVQMTIGEKVYNETLPVTLEMEAGKYLIHVELENSKPLLALKIEKQILIHE